MSDPRKLFFTGIPSGVSEIYSEVPWDAELHGLSYHAGEPVLVWSSRDGVGHLVQKVRREFYVAQLGSELPDDAGEMIGMFIFPNYVNTFHLFEIKQAKN